MSLWATSQSKSFWRSGDPWTLSSPVRPFPWHFVQAGRAGHALLQGFPRASCPRSVTLIFPGSELPLVPVLRKRPACLSLIIKVLHEDPPPLSQPSRLQVLSLVLYPAPPRPTHSPSTWHTFLLLSQHSFMPFPAYSFLAPFAGITWCEFLAQIYHVPL